MNGTETPAHCGREGIKQDIAGMMHDKFEVASVVGSSDSVRVVPYTQNKLLFMDVCLRPDAAVLDSFALRLYYKYGAEYLTEEQNIKSAGEQPNIDHTTLNHGVVAVTYDFAAVIRSCVFAKAKGIWVQLGDFPDFEFKPGFLKWLLHHNLRSDRVDVSERAGSALCSGGDVLTSVP